MKLWPMLGVPYAVVGEKEASIGGAIFFVFLLLIAFAVLFVVWCIYKLSQSTDKNDSPQKQEDSTTTISKETTEQIEIAEESE